ncbi:LADA_0G03884g1_1 [Lachancea dasiensis]|uniref:LADA_0G03884g1_1 n=1 Tax=Lachancea dasiensis TaxID=1072105 RepID=A0A1G4JRV8_9SACH|nr:LADA_0G03884g1_1 [Lachancea dasiensis]
MSDLNGVLRQINESLASTSESLEALAKQYRTPVSEGEETRNKVMRNVLGQNGELEKVSLLSLKNGSLLAYVNSLAQVVGEKLSRQDATASRARESSVQHRVVLERGVRPLEKQLAYQLDKLTRAYTRMETEYVTAEKRALQKQEERILNGEDEGSAAEESDSDSDDEALSFRPNVSGIADLSKGSRTSRSRQSHETKDQNDNENDNDNEGDDGGAANATYKPPKISAMLPPQQHHFEDKFDAQQHKDRSGKSRMQAMDEYVREMSEQPEWEASVGTNILNHGKGGIKSTRDTEREQRVKDYEENNFTRLTLKGNKDERRRAKQREKTARLNTIGGEDFGIFNSKRKLEDSTSRRATKKPHSAWDRAKRRL